MRDLSFLIPARNEEWLGRTVQDILSNIRADSEIIVVLDGEWPNEPLPQHERLSVIYLPKAIGQRAATNLAACVSTAKYVCKVDAHVSIAEGMDKALLDAAETLGPNVCQIPAQKNLHVYDWICTACGRREYQCGLKECRGCGSTELTRDVVWKPRSGVHTKRWRFDGDLHFQYWGGEGKGEFVETMSCLGACWFISHEQWDAIGGLDEDHGSWGQVGTELSCKVWLSGGRMVTNNKTWYAHFFRVGGQQFPYPITGSQQEYARRYSQNLWRGNHWPGQTLPLKWLIDKFWPVPGWTEEQRDALPGDVQSRRVDRGAAVELQSARHGSGSDRGSDRSPADPATPSKGCVYYSDCRPDPYLLDAVRRQLDRVAPGPIVAVTLAPVELPDGWRGQIFEAERGIRTMFQQILAGLEAIDTDVVFLCEHDVLYHPSHFDFTPPDRRTYYYNPHVWKVDAQTGRALHYRCNQTSGLCAHRELLLNHYRARVAHVSAYGFSRGNGFEPGTRQVANGGYDDYGHATWWSEGPNIDIRHGLNLTESRWRKDQFRNQRYTEGWTESDSVPGWGQTLWRFEAFLAEVMRRSAADRQRVA